MKEMTVKGYLVADKMVNRMVSVLKNRKGASTVEYVAVLAGAAAIGMVLLSNKDKFGKSLGGIVEKAISSIGGGK